MDGDDVLAAIRDRLAAAGAEVEELRHPPVTTAGEAAEVRGTPLAMGAKTIVLKIDDRFALFALSAAARIRTRHLRRGLGMRRARFADADELARLTGLRPGAVPPFGEPVLPLPLHADAALAERERIAFTPGVRDRSMIVAAEDWLRVAEPHVFPFAEE